MSKPLPRPKLKDLEKRFSCGTTKYGTDDVDWQTQEFATLEQAAKRYEEMSSDTSKHAYLGEIGVFENGAKALEIDWITFRTNNPNWLSDSKNSLGADKRNLRGWGRPLSEEKKPYTAYQIFEELRKP